MTTKKVSAKEFISLLRDLLKGVNRFPEDFELTGVNELEFVTVHSDKGDGSTRLYQTISRETAYPGIEMQIHGRNGTMKYPTLYKTPEISSIFFYALGRSIGHVYMARSVADIEKVNDTKIVPE